MFTFTAANPDAGRQAPAGPADTPAMAAFQQLEAAARKGQTHTFIPFAGKTGASPPTLDARLLELPAVRETAALYDALHTRLEAGTNFPGWMRGIYPTPEIAAIAWEKGSLYLLRDEAEALAGAVVLNQEPEAAYADADWGGQALRR